MSISRFIAIGLATILIIGCQSGNSKAVRTAPAKQQVETARPVDLRVFGSASADSIEVAIVGMSVQRPGRYFLSRGATVHDAIDAAQGFKDFVDWSRGYSGIFRPRANGSVELIWFSPEKRASDERRILKNNDSLVLSHETY